mmetsp:Transcript_33426/g.61386  ORF Transcript_33426/g.61386 Transcript_33426/m.61386 type:complete len:215 (-) Transcript_33426:704-1348(-)
MMAAIPCISPRTLSERTPTTRRCRRFPPQYGHISSRGSVVQASTREAPEEGSDCEGAAEEDAIALLESLQFATTTTERISPPPSEKVEHHPHDIEYGTHAVDELLRRRDWEYYTPRNERSIENELSTENKCLLSLKPAATSAPDVGSVTLPPHPEHPKHLPFDHPWSPPPAPISAQRNPLHSLHHPHCSPAWHVESSSKTMKRHHHHHHCPHPP